MLNKVLDEECCGGIFEELVPILSIDTKNGIIKTKEYFKDVDGKISMWGWFVIWHLVPYDYTASVIDSMLNDKLTIAEIICEFGDLNYGDSVKVVTKDEQSRSGILISNTDEGMKIRAGDDILVFNRSYIKSVEIKVNIKNRIASILYLEDGFVKLQHEGMKHTG